MPARTKEDVLEQINDQIGFLKTSGHSYDCGNRKEAKRLAAAIMVLVHDGRTSKSLLTQLGAKETMTFIDTGGMHDVLEAIIRADVGEGRVACWKGPRLLMTAIMGPNPSVYRPLYDETLSSAKQLPFREWWDQEVIMDNVGTSFSRGKLVALLRDKDGGAHVDDTIPESYHGLTRGKSTNMILYVGDDLVLDEGPAFPTVRQIAFELERSIEKELATGKWS